MILLKDYLEQKGYQEPGLNDFVNLVSGLRKMAKEKHVRVEGIAGRSRLYNLYPDAFLDECFTFAKISDIVKKYKAQ